MITLNRTLMFVDMFGEKIAVTPIHFEVDLVARMQAKSEGDICNGCGFITAVYNMRGDDIRLHLPIFLAKDAEFFTDEYCGYVELPFIGNVLISDLLQVNKNFL